MKIFMLIRKYCFFLSKIFFERKLLNSVFTVYFLFPDIDHDADFKSAEFVSCIIHVSGVTAIQKPEVARSSAAIDHIF